ncbi:ElyC/SanA/YdcF family protein [Gulosibacter faecalis]|uniref:ElyC/SanA/YdcF family protein n=1 Tax=Gulosibacter faecalis TaxID=272240 RepID=A0ABW5UZX3_9MICO|nr:ElyC/SanA/YdcF family protein [Gulosibacter faecalis]
MAASAASKRRSALGWLRLALITTLCSAVAWCSLVSVNIAFPQHGVDGRYDVIVSLAPGEFRLPTALDLYESGGVAEHLAVSWIADDALLSDTDRYSRIVLQTSVCERNADANLFCFEPVEDSTLGEALALRELLIEHEWTSVLLVTDRPHAFRAKYVFSQCLPAGTRVDVEVAPTELTPGEWAEELVYENAAIVKAVFESAVKCH